MTLPRQNLPGSTYLVTRRVSERRFFLRPNPEIEQTFGYLLAVAAERFDVDVHYAVVLSNHYHVLLTDRSARISEFSQYFNRLSALAINVLRGRDEAVWSSDQPNYLRCETPDDTFRKAVYLLANPVSAGLVQTGGMWRSTGWQAAASLSYADVPALAKDALAGEVASRATGLRAWATSSTEAGCVSGG